MHKDVLFRGCTRPAMVFGVPYAPFGLVVGGCFLLAVYTNFLLLLLMPPIIYTMRIMARRDDMIFHLLGLRWQFKFLTRNRDAHAGMWVYSPILHREPEGRRRGR